MEIGQTGAEIPEKETEGHLRNMRNTVKNYNTGIIAVPEREERMG